MFKDGIKEEIEKRGFPFAFPEQFIEEAKRQLEKGWLD